MKIRFLKDPETGLPHIYEHAVTEEEVRQILERAGEILPGKRESKIKLGQTGAGRFLQVVYTRDPEPNSFFVVTAYDLKGKALKAHRRRRRRKQR